MNTIKAIVGAVTGAILVVILFLLIGYLPDVLNEPNEVKTTTSDNHLTTPPMVQDNQAVTPETVAQQPVPILSESIYLASNDLDVYQFNVERAAAFFMLLTIEGDVPIDVITLPKLVKAEQWLLEAELMIIAGVFTLHGTQDVFSSAWSKKAAFREYQSGWINLEPGQYTVILDNTDQFTPSRGDALVNIQIYAE